MESFIKFSVCSIYACFNELKKNIAVFKAQVNVCVSVHDMCCLYGLYNAEFSVRMLLYFNNFPRGKIDSIS